MPRGLFGSFDDDFETNPIARATGSVAKQAAKAAAAQVKKTVKTAVAQVKGTKGTKGTTGSTSQQTTTDDHKLDDAQLDTTAANVDPVAQARKALTAPVYFHPSMDKNQKVNTDPNSPGFIPMGRTPDEQEEIQKVRKELYHHRNYYYDQAIGRVSDIEGDQRRKRFQREQEEARRKQDEEEEKRIEEEKKARNKRETLPMPTGKGRNRMGMPGVPRKNKGFDLTAGRMSRKAEVKAAGAG